MSHEIRASAKARIQGPYKDFHGCFKGKLRYFLKILCSIVPPMFIRPKNKQVVTFLCVTKRKLAHWVHNFNNYGMHVSKT